MKRPLTLKGIFLGFTLFLLALVSTLLVQVLRPSDPAQPTPSAQQP